MIGADSIATVLEALRPERTRVLELLGGLADDEWAAPTECPLYSVKGIATHVLGDDLSLLSRQRDHATQGLLLVAEELPGADFRTLLDTFNDRWVAAARFLSADLLVELLRLAGEWTSSYYDSVDPLAPCEPVGFFGPTGEPSPFWQAIAREYMERWVHTRRSAARSLSGHWPKSPSSASVRRLPPQPPGSTRQMSAEHGRLVRCRSAALNRPPTS